MDPAANPSRQQRVWLALAGGSIATRRKGRFGCRFILKRPGDDERRMLALGGQIRRPQAPV
jgi:hypothetical protein